MKLQKLLGIPQAAIKSNETKAVNRSVPQKYLLGVKIAMNDSLRMKCLIHELYNFQNDIYRF